MNIPKIGEVRKAIINVVGLGTSLVTLGFIHGQALVIVNTIIAVLTAALHYSVPNDISPSVVREIIAKKSGER